jgi:methyl-accepting chemotaxis protein
MTMNRRDHTKILVGSFLVGAVITIFVRFFDKASALVSVFEWLLLAEGLGAVAVTWINRGWEGEAPFIVRTFWEIFAGLLAFFAMASVTPWAAFGIFVAGIGLSWYESQAGGVATKSDAAQLAPAIKQKLQELDEVVQKMGGASGQVSDATVAQTESVDNQSAAIAEIATALSEINVTSQQASEQASNVVSSAETSEQISQRGIESVSQNIDGLHRISEQVEAITANIFDLNEQTNQIGEIVATSSELAERSHVLALNASVEAARSGEAGKGFQVVAQEMKNLARQSKQATERIRRILGEIQRATQQVVTATEEGSRRVTAGIHLAQQAGEIIRQLSQVISGSATSARLIATASRQLSGGIEQISTAMGELTSLTGGIVMVGKSADDAVRSLNTLSGELVGIIDAIRVVDTTGHTSPPPESPPPSITPVRA